MESELHKKLKDRAIDYFYNKSYWIIRPEVECGYYGKYDVWGINSSLETLGVEIKVSKADFKNNKWKEHKLEFGINQINWKIDGKPIDRIAQQAIPASDIIPANENYILCPSGMLQPEEIHPLYGLLWFNGERLINKKKPQFLEMTDTAKLRTIMLFLSSKMNKNNL